MGTGRHDERGHNGEHGERSTHLGSLAANQHNRPARAQSALRVLRNVFENDSLAPESAPTLLVVPTSSTSRSRVGTEHIAGEEKRAARKRSRAGACRRGGWLTWKRACSSRRPPIRPAAAAAAALSPFNLFFLLEQLRGGERPPLHLYPFVWLCAISGSLRPLFFRVSSCFVCLISDEGGGGIPKHERRECCSVSACNFNFGRVV